MDTRALNDRNGALQHAQGLAISLLLHAIAVSVAVMLIADLHLTHQPELFKWDVVMVEAPSQQPSQDTLMQTPTQAKPTPVMPTSTAPRHIQKTIEKQSILHTIQPVERVVLQEMVQARPIAQRAMEPIHRPTEEISQTMSRTVQTPTPDLPVHSTPAPVNNVTPIEKDTAVLSTPPEAAAVTKQIMTETTPLSSSESAVVSRSTIEATQTSPIVHERIVNETVPTLTESTIVVERARAIETPTAREPSETKPAEPASIEQAKIPGPHVTELSAVREPPPRSHPQAKADFGWLTRTLLSRIEQLKRYPHAARLNHWEGKVVLRAVIREDGHVIGVDVAESSGHSALDDDAVDVLRKASPLELAHPLGQPQVVIRVPIRYRLEQ
ncbi:MAG: TonB family protein [Nitrospirales bacterium]